MTNTITETVRYWGACSDNGDVPPRMLSDFMAELNAAMNEIPREYRATAEIDFDPDSEYGETYDAVRITYERPETPAETTVRLENERWHWNEQLATARERVAYCTAQIDALPVKRRV